MNNFKKLATTTLLAALVCSSLATAPEAEERRQLQPQNYLWMSTSHVTAKKVGEGLGIAICLVQVFIFIFLFLDVLFRGIANKRLNLIGTLRSLIVFTGIASTWLLGRSRLYAHGGPSINVVFNWIWRYVYKIGFDADDAHIFEPIKTDNEVLPTGFTGAGFGYENFFNRLFYPGLISLVLWGAKLGLLGLIKEKVGWANAIGGLSWIFNWAIFYQVFAWSFYWWRLFFDITKYNRNQADNIDMWNAGYLFGWLFMLIFFGIFLYDHLIRLFLISADSILPMAKDSTPEGVTLKDIEYDTALMFVKRGGIPYPLAHFFNGALVFKWFLYVFIGMILDIYPRFWFGFMWVFDLLFLGFTVACSPGFVMPAGIFIIASEFFLMLAHFFHWLVWQYVEGRYSWGKKWVDFYTRYTVVFYFIVLLVEVFIMFFGFTASSWEGNAAPAPAAAFEDNAFSELSNNELNNKIQTYNTMRSGVKQQDSNRN